MLQLQTIFDYYITSANQSIRYWPTPSCFLAAGGLLGAAAEGEAATGKEKSSKSPVVNSLVFCGVLAPPIEGRVAIGFFDLLSELELPIFLVCRLEEGKRTIRDENELEGRGGTTGVQ